jgi:hypothetical protein
MRLYALEQKQSAISFLLAICCRVFEHVFFWSHLRTNFSVVFAFVKTRKRICVQNLSACLPNTFFTIS